MNPEPPENSSDRPADPPRRRKRYAGRYPHRPDQRYKELAPERFPDMQDHVRAQGRTPAGTHVPVLVAEVLAALRPQPGETAVDCTVGYGGHALELLKRIGPTGRLVGFDRDAAALENTRERLEKVFPGPDAEASGRSGLPAAPRLVLRHGNFAGLDRALAEEGLDGADVILADLGASSMQIDDPARGFSYKFDGPLDMRMDPRLPRTAADLLRTMPEAALAAAMENLADEPDAAAIAQRIVLVRGTSPVARTLELVHLIIEAKGLSPQHWRKQAAAAGEDLHPAARTFQALRIAVNDELGALRQLLRVAPACLRPGGRIAIISFQSGEDRLVKQAFRDGVTEGVYAATGDELVRPDAKERAANPRSAAAKLRWAVKA
jgi:16S rRNA (cytosine1402-N4)-methyltransferase